MSAIARFRLLMALAILAILAPAVGMLMAAPDQERDEAVPAASITTTP